MSDKNQLLDEVDKVVKSSYGLNGGYFVGVLLLLIFGLLVVFPKIYLAQQIYYKSRNISKLEAEYNTLKEENKKIKGLVEKIKFKNQILDTIF